MSVNLLQRTRHAKRTSGHRDMRIALHTGHLTTAIEAGQDMTASDIHIGIAFHTSGSVEPLTCSVGEVTRTATIDTAVEGTSVGGNLAATVRSSISCAVSTCIYVVRSVVRIRHYCTIQYRLSIEPAVTFGQRCTVLGRNC